MKYSYQSIVTPSKLINPFQASIKPKQYKPIKTYLELNKITPRHMKNKLFDDENLSQQDLNKVAIRDYPLLSFRVHNNHKTKKLNKSCKLRKPLDNTPRVAKDKFEIPEIKYKEFEPFHLPSVKVKIKVETFRPKPFWATMKQETEDSILPDSVQSPSRIEIAEHSKEYGAKLQRVTDIAKKMKSEFV